MPTKEHIVLDEIFEDYATTPVPQSKTVGGVGIGMINGGLAFAVPGLITGIEIGQSLGLIQAIYAFLVGGLLLSLLGTVTGLVGMHNRLTSCMTMKFVFGNQGANILSFAFVISLLGWYGVNIDLFSSVAQEGFDDFFNVSIDIWQLEIAIGFLIIITTIWGFELLNKISTALVPILFVILAYLVYQSMDYVAPPEKLIPINPDLTFGSSVSIIVGSFIVSVVLMPDFTRFAAKPRDTATASFLPFFIICNFVYIAAAIAGIAVKDDAILQVMLTLGLGSFAFFLLITSSWIANVVNLYSAALGLNAMNAKWKEWKLIIVAGALGTVVASLNLLDNFTDFLFSLSSIFTPVAAIYVVDFFFINQSKVYNVANIEQLNNFNVNAIFAWFIGIVISIISNLGIITLTTIEVCDAIIVTCPVYYLLMKFFPLKAKLP